MANETEAPSKPVNPERVVEKAVEYTAARLTFIGGPDTGDKASDTWGNDATGRITFPLREPILVDPNTQGSTKAQKAYLAHVIAKARTNRFYTVEDVKPGDKPAPAAEVKQPAPQPRTQSNPHRGRSRY